MKRTFDDTHAERGRRLRELADRDRDELVAEAESLRCRLVKLGATLREAREAAGVTIDEVARHTGNDVITVEWLETGRIDPTYLDLADYAAAIGRDVGLVLEETADIEGNA